MSRDPYFDVKSEVTQTLSHLQRLHSTLLSLPPSPPSSDEAPSTIEEIRGALSVLETDLDDLDESVRLVERAGGQWGIDEGEVARRRKWVEWARAEVEVVQSSLRDRARGPGSSRSAATGKWRAQTGGSSGHYRDEEEAVGDERRSNEVDHWEQEEQLSLMNNQDQTLNMISGTLSTLHGQASLMGREAGEQNIMIEDLLGHVDQTEGRLNKAMKKMQDFIHKSEEKGSGWCIVILTILLIILLMAVILV